MFNYFQVYFIDLQLYYVYVRESESRKDSS